MLLAEALSSFHFKGDHFVTLNQVRNDFCFHDCFYSIACRIFPSLSVNSTSLNSTLSPVLPAGEEHTGFDLPVL
jgi:hypothetical protein